MLGYWQLVGCYCAALGLAVALIAAPAAFAEDVIVLQPGSFHPDCAANDSCLSQPQIQVNVGDAVKWINDDAAFHTVTHGTPGSERALFDFSLFPRNEASFAFEEAGEYAYYCRVHPWTQGAVTVTEAGHAAPDTPTPADEEAPSAAPADAEPDLIVSITAGSYTPACGDDDVCFDPHTAMIGAGQTVGWVNDDTVFHTATSGAPADPEGFFNGWLLPGETFTYTFGAPGTYQYHCAIHPWAVGEVVVAGAPPPQIGPPPEVPAPPEGALPEISDRDKARQRLTEKMADAAIQMFRLDPHLTIKGIHDPDDVAYRFGDISLFIVDGNGTIIANGERPSLAGTLIHEWTDAAGASLGDIIEGGASPYGKWATYWYADPLYPEGEPQRMLVWLKDGGGHGFAAQMRHTGESHAYSDYDLARVPQVEEMVADLQKSFDADRESAIAGVNSMSAPYSAADSIVLIADAGTILASNIIQSETVGESIDVLVTSRGVRIADIPTTPYGSWAEIYFLNPTLGGAPLLHLSYSLADGDITYLVLLPTHPEYDFSGYDREDRRIATEMVEQAIGALDADLESALEAIADHNNALYHDGGIYVSVDESEQSVPYGNYAERQRLNPLTGQAEQSLVWTKTWEGYAVQAGVFVNDEPRCAFSESDQQKARIAERMVDSAMEAYNGDQGAAFLEIEDADNALYHDGELYVFVLDADNTIVSHGVTPSLVDTSLYDLVDVEGTNIGELVNENRSPYGKWVEYWWPNPATETDEGERKVSFVKTSGDMAFSVGVYPDTECAAHFGNTLGAD